MALHPSGYYAWKSEPASARKKEDERLGGLIKQSWLESGGVYGYRKITHDLRDLGERCGKHRIYRLMKRKGYAPKSAIVAAQAVMVGHRSLLRINWSSNLMSKRRIRSGSPISPTSGPTKAGCIWRSYWISSRAK